MKPVASLQLNEHGSIYPMKYSELLTDDIKSNIVREVNYLRFLSISREYKL